MMRQDTANTVIIVLLVIILLILIGVSIAIYNVYMRVRKAAEGVRNGVDNVTDFVRNIFN